MDWKYNVDESSKWLKKMYFRFVFLKFNEFSYWLFDLLPPNGRDQTGRLCWTEDFGCRETEWEAHQESLKYRFGHCIRVPLNGSLSADTVNTEQIHPHSTPEVQKMYEKKTEKGEVILPQLDVVRLIAKVASTDGLVEQFRSPV